VWQQVLFWWTQGTRAVPHVLILKCGLKIENGKEKQKFRPKENEKQGGKRHL
jgi:hypothetical protein